MERSGPADKNGRGHDELCDTEFDRWNKLPAMPLGKARLGACSTQRRVYTLEGRMVILERGCIWLDECDEFVP